MLLELALVPLIYLLIFVALKQDQYTIKIGNEFVNLISRLLHDDEDSFDVVDTPREGVVQHKIHEALETLINQSKAHLLLEKKEK